MDVRFVPPDLRRLDKLEREACWLSFFETDRPLRGVLGLIDWRMGGYVSRQLLRGRFRARYGERLLMPCARYLPYEKLLLHGLGRPEDLDDQRRLEVSEAMLSCFDGLGLRSGVCALPGRVSGRVALR